ncbi:MAG: Fic family protein [Candidatus Electrothrix sp. Rat3]|nr:Fic family protein [Candidatus Electrothrix rattekaaiensis]
MQLFPVYPQLSLDEADEQVKDFWNNLASAEEFTEELKELSNQAVYAFFQKIPKELHKQLFGGILNNAGGYRKITDPNNGEVFFGPSTNQFAGADPLMIDSMLRKNISSLTLSPPDPVYIAARFYQRFVSIHPFNDGNGRISRFMVEVYLIYHQYRIDFEQLRKTTRWLKQLNYCHRKTNKPLAYPHSLKWWVHHFRKFVVHENELNNF